GHEPVERGEHQVEADGREWVASLEVRAVRRAGVVEVVLEVPEEDVERPVVRRQVVDDPQGREQAGGRRRDGDPHPAGDPPSVRARPPGSVRTAHARERTGNGGGPPRFSPLSSPSRRAADPRATLERLGRWERPMLPETNGHTNDSIG